MKLKTFFLMLFFSSAALAQETYECHVIGEFTNYEAEKISIESESFEVKLNAVRPTLIDTKSGVWALSLNVVQDGPETPMRLALFSPNQNAAVGFAYAEPGSKYIGFVYDSSLEALCRLK